MALLDALDKLAGYFNPTVNASCLTLKEISEMRLASQVAYPDHPQWHALHYPGEMTLPIFLTPAPPQLSPVLHAAAAALHKDILKEGFTHSQFQIYTRYEHRQVHFWMAKLSRNQFLPIGQASFVLEDRKAGCEEDPPTDGPKPSTLRLAGKQPERILRRWWMHLAWLRPAYRCQFIFRHTVPYFEQWHPGFLVRDPNPPLSRSLKEFPQHIFDGRVQWWDGMSSGHE